MKKETMTIKARLIKRINQELPFVPISSEDMIFHRRGKGTRDAGELSWYSSNGVGSDETMTDLLKAKELSALVKQSVNHPKAILCFNSGIDYLIGS